jgi:hypothetical protein
MQNLRANTFILFAFFFWGSGPKKGEANFRLRDPSRALVLLRSSGCEWEAIAWTGAIDSHAH